MKTFLKRLFSGWIIAELIALGLSVHYWLFLFPEIIGIEGWEQRIGNSGWLILFLESCLSTWAVGFLLAACCYLRHGHFGQGYREMELVGKNLSDAA